MMPRVDKHIMGGNQKDVDGILFGDNVLMRKLAVYNEVDEAWQVRDMPIVQWDQYAAYSTVESCESARAKLKTTADEALQKVVESVVPNENADMRSLNRISIDGDEELLAQAIKSRCVPADVLYAASK
jgi:hypothetical protein